uniref:NHR2-like domain-containing protein n=1 Tax=Hucho hucho TaxID=62062 RepID=A0A4W5LCJ2_9TELE
MQEKLDYNILLNIIVFGMYWKRDASSRLLNVKKQQPMELTGGLKEERTRDGNRLTYCLWCLWCFTQRLPPPQLLNCIMDMVEKTRRSLTVLRRCQEADREELNYWIRRYSDAEDLKKGASRTQSRGQSPTGQDNYTTGITIYNIV